MINLSQVVISSKEIQAVLDVCKSGQLAQGKKVAGFEKMFAEYCGCKYAVAVNSGTAALHVALIACGIGPGDEVITTPFSFIATANSILMAGAKPVFADIDPDTYNVDPQKIEEKITKKTKAILPVDLYGQVYDVENVKEIAGKYDLQVIEDAAQAVGAATHTGCVQHTPGVWKKAGSLSDAGCFSFYATKNLFTGEGGMLVTDNKKIYELAKMFRHHGQSEKGRFKYYGLGYNYRMTEIAAVMGLIQLTKIDLVNNKRIDNANYFSKSLKDIHGLILPKTMDKYKHIFHQYTVRVTKDFRLTRDELSEYLKANGIITSVYYPQPLHLSPHLSILGYKKGDFPVAEKISREVLSIPVHQHLTRRDLDYIIDIIRKITDK